MIILRSAQKAAPQDNGVNGFFGVNSASLLGFAAPEEWILHV
jgi:hypothetical protein